MTSQNADSNKEKTMIAYNNDEKVKSKYVARMRAHIKADELVQGTGFESNGKTRGCAVGCTLDRYDHKGFETELGIPEDVARLFDTLFEGLPVKNAPEFALDFLLAVKPGSDLTRIRFKFCAFLMREALARVEALTLNADLKKQVIDAIWRSLKLNEEAGEGGVVSANRWSAARSAARSARSAARSAVRSAAWSAGNAAESAARSARSAAESAARSAAYKTYAKEFLRLVKEA